MNRRAFTLVELLVVIAIIGVLVALLLPAVQAAREAARRSSCANNLHQLALAIHNFESAHGHLPTTNQNPVHNWGAQILPYMEQKPLADIYDYTVGFNAVQNRTAVQTHLKYYQCPSTPEPKRTNPHFPASGTPRWPAAVADYAACAGIFSNLWSPPNPVLTVGSAANADGIFQGNSNAGKRRLAETTDGTSNTILVFESAGRPQKWQAGKLVPGSGTTTANSVLVCGWAEGNVFVARGFTPDGVTNKGPCAVNCSNHFAVYAFHPAGANVSLGDGSTRLLTRNIHINTFAALCTREGGETIPGDY